MTRRRSITSTANDRLKAVRRLARHLRREPVFLVEGHAPVRRALEAGAPVRELYAAPELFLGPADRALVALAEQRGARVYELGAAAFASITRQVRADGLTVVVGRLPTRLGRVTLPAGAFVVVADAIERPGNLGAIVRTAAAAGANALVVSDPVTDLFHPETVRGSVGTLFALPLAESTAGSAVPWLREQGVRLVVTSPNAERPYWDSTTRARSPSSWATSGTASRRSGSTPPTSSSSSPCPALRTA